jgi:hypothetical protein
MKPNLCAWLFHAWIHVKNMNEMMCKGWEKIGLLKSFNMQFQLEAMEVNAITPLFSVTFNSEFKQHKKEVDAIDLEDSIFDIIWNCLNVQIIGI